MPLQEAKWQFEGEWAAGDHETGVTVCKDGGLADFKPMDACEIVETFNRMRARILELEARMAILHRATKDIS